MSFKLTKAKGIPNHSNVFVRYQFVKMAKNLKRLGIFYNVWHTYKCQSDVAKAYAKFQTHLQRLSRGIKWGKYKNGHIA